MWLSAIIVTSVITAAGGYLILTWVEILNIKF